MNGILKKRFSKPIGGHIYKEKILEYIADIYSKNFNDKTIPINKLNIVEELPNYGEGTKTYYITSIVDKFDYHDIMVVAVVNRNGDVLDYKMYENVVNPSNICESFTKSFENYDGGDW